MWLQAIGDDHPLRAFQRSDHLPKEHTGHKSLRSHGKRRCRKRHHPPAVTSSDIICDRAIAPPLSATGKAVSPPPICDDVDVVIPVVAQAVPSRAQNTETRQDPDTC